MANILCGSVLLVLLNSFLVLCRPNVLVNETMHSFSNAIKGGHLVPGEEYLLYESDTGEPGVITEQWFTGEGCMNENTMIRIYIDGEEYPSIEFLLLLGHGIGFVDSSSNGHGAWNTKRISADADNNLYDTYQIPFSKSFRVTATDPVGGTFWYIIRGVYNFPLMFGVLELPSTARLRLYKNVDVTLQPFEFIDLVNVQNTGGTLFQVTLAARSSDFTYLEGCMRAYIDGSNSTTFLSSGTEDFFLSAFYYNAGLYHSDNSGLTFKADPGTMSAYKFFEDDPILFRKSFRLQWRCGEVIGTGFEECPNAYLGSKKLSASQSSAKTKIIASPDVDLTVVTTYTWVYEW